MNVRHWLIIVSLACLGAAGCTTGGKSAKSERVGIALTGKPATHEQAPIVARKRVKAGQPIRETAPKPKKKKPSLFRRLFPKKSSQEKQEAADAPEKEPAADEKKEKDPFWAKVFPEPKPLTLYPDSIEEVHERERRRRERKKRETILGRIFGRKKKMPAPPSGGASHGSGRPDASGTDGTSDRTVALSLAVSAAVPAPKEGEDSPALRLVVPVPLSGERQVVRKLSIEAAGTPVSRYSARAKTRMIDVAPGEGAREVTVRLTCVVRRSGEGGGASADEDAETMYAGSVDEVSRQKAREIAPEGDRTRRARRIFDFVCDRIRLAEDGPDVRGDASKALTQGVGDVSDIATLFVTLCRGAGVPARLVTGVRLPAGRRSSSQRIEKLVIWAEFLDDESKWISVDVAASRDGATSKDVAFGKLTAGHVALAVESGIRDEPAYPVLLAGDGRPKEIDVEILMRDIR